jgi:hypothetical protein
MVLRVTIDIFSGRENPVIELKGKEAQEAIERLQPVRGMKREERRLPPVPTLGYRGLVIEQIGKPVRRLPKTFRFAHGDLFGPGLAHRAADEAFEDFVCGSTGPIRRLKLGREFPMLVKKEIERFRKLRQKWPRKKPYWSKRILCRCAPLYEPDWWNDLERAEFIRCRHNDDYANYDTNPDRFCPFFRRSDYRPYEWFSRQHLNNCYNYATNYRTDTFAQPGRAAEAMYTALSCASVKSGAIKDDLIDNPSANNKCPFEGHLVALVIWPGVDFHWYRKGRNRHWSHKPGSTPVTNLDSSGNIISDPRTADRGSYTSFCTFMVVKHGHIKII